MAYYRERLLALADPSSSLSRYVTVRKYIDEKNFAQADFINRHSLSRMDPASHDYANLAYFQARICESLNRREDMKNWFIRSAMADIKTATKDNASLFSLADALFKDGDYARAFKYSSFSLEDAIASTPNCANGRSPRFFQPCRKATRTSSRPIRKRQGICLWRCMCWCSCTRVRTGS